MSERKTKRADVTIRRQQDGSYLLTAQAPRDGAGREVSAPDLHYPMTKQEARTLSDNLVWLLAGER